MMRRTDMRLSGLCVVEPEVHEDTRGFFMETYRADVFNELGIKKTFVQDTHSHSRKGVVRGLKFQFDEPTDKLIRVAAGEVFAVGVDIRSASTTFGQWESVELSSENKKILYVPFGFAFGFCAMSESADVIYKLSALHNEQGGGTIRWNDADIGIPWPESAPIVSAGDAQAPTFREWHSAGDSGLIQKVLG